MQLSHLTVYCMCVLLIVCRCGRGHASVSKVDLEKCIVTRVCTLADFNNVADCAEEVFSSQNVSFINLHLSTKNCVNVSQQSPDIGWFMDQPLQQWIGQCWNKKKCSVQIGGIGARQVRIVIMIGTEGGLPVITPSACLITASSEIGDTEGNVIRQYDGKNKMDHERKMHLCSSASTSLVPWVLPAFVYNTFLKERRRRGRKRKRPELKVLKREKRQSFGDEMLDDKLPSELKDIIFSDNGDSSDMFTGELSQEDKIWDADLPNTLGPVMTFPDEYMNTVSLKGAEGNKNAKGPAKQKNKKLGQKKFSTLKNESPGYWSSDGTLSARMGPAVMKTDAMQGEDMLTALETDIENKLHSSLNSLMEAKDARDKEDMSLVAGLALENTVTHTLASVEKEPSVALENQDMFVKQHIMPSTLLSVSSLSNKSNSPDVGNQDSGPIPAKLRGSSSFRVRGRGEKTNGETTRAEVLPPPPPVVDSMNKPKLPPKSDNVTKPSPGATATKNPAVAKPVGDATQKPTLMMNVSQATNITAKANQTASPPSANPQVKANRMQTAKRTSNGSRSISLTPATPRAQIPKTQSSQGRTLAASNINDNILKAEAMFQASSEQLKKDMREVLHVTLHPRRKQLLKELEESVLQSTHAVTWAMVKQVCEAPLRRMMATDSGWQDWSAWSPCTITCGSNGYHIRRRTCKPYLVCTGSNYDLQLCKNKAKCLESAVWLDWSTWGQCSVSCGEGGVQFRVRSCLTDDPAVICPGQGTEVMKCDQQPCGGTGEKNQDKAKQHRKGRKKPKKKGKGHPTTTTPAPSSTPQPPHHRRRRKKRPLWTKSRLHHRGEKRSHTRSTDPEEVESAMLVSDAVNDMEDVQAYHALRDTSLDKGSIEAGFQAMEGGDRGGTGAMEKLQQHDDFAWSAWGLWSSCSVSCSKGTQFRHRECMKRIGDSFEGEPVKSTHCKGVNKARMFCSEGPCPMSIAIPKSLARVREGKEGVLNCTNTYKGQTSGLYWIAPSGERISKQTRNKKYKVDNLTLLIQNASQADLGEYLCVLVGPRLSTDLLASKNTSSFKDGSKSTESRGGCWENPCENGGTCQPISNFWPVEPGAPRDYSCLCKEGHYGNQCEQKSLVDANNPKLRAMGGVLAGIIGLCLMVCTCMCIYYMVDSRKHRKTDFQPVMTRRRSEDQWRKMKSFDNKVKSRKKSFSAKNIKKRLSRMWTNKPKDDQKVVTFGIDSPTDDSLHGSSVSNKARSPLEIAEDEFEDFGHERLTSSLKQPSKQEREVKQMLEDTSQNASPPPTLSAEEINKEVYAELRNKQRPQGDQGPVLQVNPLVFYDDDRMEMFANTDTSHVQDVEKRIMAESYSPFLCASKESVQTHIFRSRQCTKENSSGPEPQSSLTSQVRSKRKRRSKKHSDRSSRAEYEFNQNNSDESNDGNAEPPPWKASTEVMNSGQTRRRHSNDSPSGADTRDRGPAENREGWQNGQLSSSGSGARPKVGSASKHKLGKHSQNDARDRYIQDESPVLRGVTGPLDSRHDYRSDGFHCQSQPDRPGRTVPNGYDVHHPDEAYPYRMSRTRRKFRDTPEDFGPSRSAFDQPERLVPGENLGRSQDEISATVEAERSLNSPQQHQRRTSTSPQRFKFLEGGGEGASTAMRSDARKSGRDMLLRRAMENSFIRATGGVEARCSPLPSLERIPLDTRWNSTSSTPSCACSSSSKDSERQAGARWQGSVLPLRQAVDTQLRADPRQQRRMLQLDSESSSDTGTSPSPQHKPPRRVRSKSGILAKKRHEGGQPSSEGTYSQLFSRQPGARGHVPTPFMPEMVHFDDSASFEPRHTFDLRHVKTSTERRADSSHQVAMRNCSSGGGRDHWMTNAQADELENGRFSGSFLLSGGQRSVDSLSQSVQRLNMTNSSWAQDDSKRLRANGGTATSALRKTSSDSPCSSRVQGLKSAMKQHSSLPSLSALVEKKASLRKVSFSEPKVHRRSELDSLLPDEDPELRWEDTQDSRAQFDTISQREGGPLATERMFEDISRRPCGPLDLDAFSSLPPTAQWQPQRENGSKGNTCAPGPDARHSLTATGHSASLWDRVSLQREGASRASRGQVHDATDPTQRQLNASLRQTQGASVIQSLDNSSFAPTTRRVSASGEAAEARFASRTCDGQQGDWQAVQPPLLVDVEPPCGGTDHCSQRPEATAREEEPISQQLLRRSLLSPLTPSPAPALPSPAERHTEQSQSSAFAEGASRAAATDSPPGPYTSPPPHPNPLSFDVFQEMLAVRTPDAYFKPIDKGSRSEQTE